MLATLPVSEIRDELYIDHLDCPRDPLVIGVYVVCFDDVQLDELATNGYTVVTEGCLYCREQSSFLLRADHLKDTRET